MAHTIRQRKIIEILSNSPEPLSARELAAQLDCVIQTIYNSLYPLVDAGIVVIVARSGNANMFQISGTIDSSLRMTWKGDFIPLREFVEMILRGDQKVSNPFVRNIAVTIMHLYALSLASLSDDDPRIIPQETLKQLQNSMQDMRDLLKLLDTAAESLLNLDGLWSPRELPKSLIIRDANLTMERAQDYVSKLAELLRAVPLTRVENSPDVG